MRKKYKCFLFDLDGTLLDTAPEFLFCLNSLLKKHNLKEVNDKFIRERVSDGVSRLIEDGFKISSQNAKFETLRRQLLEEYQKNFLLSKLFPGVKTVLKKLSEMEIDWMVVTNKPKKFAEKIFERFKWHESASGLLTPDDAKGKSKPNPAILNMALKNTDFDKNSCVYVGDNWRDIEGAKNCGIDSILATYGYLTKKDALSLSPTNRILKISELKSFF